jgi:5-methylcytosine-specific restriction endonuclease McrA
MNNPEKNGSYGALLFRREWKDKRAQILARDRHQCINCGTEDQLQVHHRQYLFSRSLQKFNDPWDYSDHVMITLCQECHSKGHSRFEVPIIKY